MNGDEMAADRLMKTEIDTEMMWKKLKKPQLKWLENWIETGSVMILKKRYRNCTQMILYSLLRRYAPAGAKKADECDSVNWNITAREPPMR